MSDFAGVDFTQYHNWRPVHTPTGGVYYAVPGTSFVYDPFLSATRRRPVLWQNPEPSLKQQDNARKQSSPMNQFVLPTVATVGGTVAADYLTGGHGAKAASDSVSKLADLTSKLTANSSSLNSGGGSGGGGSAGAGNAGASLTENTSSLAPSAANQAFTQSAVPQPITNGGEVGGFSSTTNPDPFHNLSGSGTPQTMVAPDGVTPVQSVQLPGGNPGVGMSDGSVSPLPPAQVPDGSWMDSAGNALQGAGGVYQAYNGIQQIRKGQYVPGAINAATGAALAAQAAGSIGAETAAEALPYLGPISAGLGAYNAAKTTGSMAAGSSRNNMAALQAGLGFAAFGGPAALAAAAAAYIGSAAFGSHKNSQQMIRDQGRKYLQSTGILDSNYEGTLADGSKFDFGKDRHSVEKLDYTDPTTGKLIALSNVLSAGEGMTGKAQAAMSEMYARAAGSNAGGNLDTGISNIRHFADQRGFNQQNVQAQLDKLLADKKISDQEHTVFSADNGQLFGGTPGAATGASTPPGTTPGSAGYTGWHPGDPVHQLAKQLAARADARNKK